MNPSYSSGRCVHRLGVAERGSPDHPCSRRVVLGMALAGLSPLAWAAYPERPVRLIAPFPPGGAGDFMARGLAQRLGAEIGQQVVVDNRSGAGGAVAAEVAARAPGDGYTLFFGTQATHAINPALLSKPRYDPVKDFTPISLTHVVPRVLVVGPSLRVTSVAELIKLAKEKPGALTYGSAGAGSTTHLAGVLFESLAGVDMLHVPYKGSAPLLTDLLGGLIDLTFDSYNVYEGHIRSGRVRALAVTSRTRLAPLPHVPALAEAGVPDYEVANWLGLMAPTGTPPEIISRLHAALGRAMADPSWKQQLQSQGIEPVFGTSAEFASLIRSDLPKWAAIVRKSGAQLN